MSLQVWLPLNGTLENQGLVDWDPTIQSGTTASYVDGKIGKALNAGGIVMPASVTKQILNNDEYSYACWIYVNGSEGSTSERAMIFGNSEMSSLGGRQFSLFQYPTANDLHFSWQNYSGGSYSSAWGGVITGALPSKKWTHIAVTYNKADTEKVKFYINGVHKTGVAYNFTSSADSFEFNTQLIHNSPYHYLNDIRLYNHTLSAKEVKELSKGLVLHYKLSGAGGENLLNNTKFINGTSNWYGVNNSKISTTTIDDIIVATGTKGTSNNIIGQTCSNYNYVGGSTINITVSAKVYVTETGTFGVGHWISTTQASGWQGMSGSRVWNTPQTLSIGWNYISTTLKNATNQYNGSIVTAFSFSGATFYITNVKFEIGIKSTPWIPNPSDTEYTFLEYSDTTEYDHSGYGNDGVKVGSFECDINTPRYTTSYIFENDCNQYIHTNHFSNLTQSITMSCWAYQTSATATSGGNSTSALFIISQGRDYDKWGFGIRSMSGVPYLYFTTTSNYQLSSNVNILNGWHHLAATYDGASAKIYVDGVLKATQNTSGDIDYTYDSGKFVVGKMSYGYSSTTAYFPFVGNISDVRIYATPLSEKDIKELYTVGTAFDKQGRIMTYEVVEV